MLVDNAERDIERVPVHPGVGGGRADRGFAGPVPLDEREHLALNIEEPRDLPSHYLGVFRRSVFQRPMESWPVALELVEIRLLARVVEAVSRGFEGADQLDPSEPWVSIRHPEAVDVLTGGADESYGVGYVQLWVAP